MITKNFIDKISLYLYKLNYYKVSTFDYENFLKRCSYVLTHTETIDDANEILSMILFINNNFKKLIKIFNKPNKLKYYNFNIEYFEKNYKKFKLIKDDKALGNYFFVNGLFDKKINNFYLTSASYKDNVFYKVTCLKNKFIIFDDYSYYLKFKSSDKINLYNKNNVCLCKIVYDSKKSIITLKKNVTKYEIYNEDIFLKKDINDIDLSLLKEDEYNELWLHKGIAFFEWDIIDTKSSYGVSKLSYFGNDNDEEDDLELLLNITLSTILVFNRWYQHMQQVQARAAALSYMMWH